MINIFVLFNLLVFLSVQQAYYNHQTTAYRNQSWISNLDDGIPLRKLSILGTHNSMATRDWDDSFQTQKQTLDIQLASGVRALDMHCRHQSNNFQMYEMRSLMVKKNMTYALGLIKAFLDVYNKEVVIMLVSQVYSNGNSRSFQDTYKFYRDQFPGLIWTPTTQNPTLGMTRGKIVVLQNFNAAEIHGIIYSSFTIHPHTSYSSNWYQYDKWIQVKSFIAATDIKGQSSISFWTGSGWSFPYFVASGKSSPGNGDPRLSTGRTTPLWNSYPDFPRVACLFSLCTIAFQGINILGAQYIQSLGFKYLGIVYIDFYGNSIISSFIAKNTQMFAKCSISLLNVGCTFCSSNGTCLGCNTALHYIYNTITFQCMSDIGYFLNATSIPQLCSSVMPGCLECSSGAACTKCDTFVHYLLSLGSCIAQPGYYLDISSIPIKCNIVGCAKCSSASVCTQCSSINNYIMDGAGNCICDGGIFFTQSPSANTCICVSGKFLATNGSCIDYPVCPDAGCGCLNCSSPPTCTFCDAANYFTLQSSYCICAVGYFFDGLQCVPCSVAINATATNVSNVTNCDQCVSFSLCLSCLDNFTLVEGLCKCLPQYYQFDSDTCLKCPIGCLVCSNGTLCTTCNSTADFILSSGICTCPKGKFIQSSACVPCSATPGCIACQVAGCTQCDTIFNYLLTPTNMLCRCIYGHFINTMNICQKCPMQGCLECVSQSVCTSCDSDGYYLGGNGVCMDICGDGKQIYVECDDGNLVNGDGCSSNCKIQQFFKCTAGGLTSPSSCSFSAAISLSVSNYIKNQKKNQFSVLMKVYPNVAILSNLDFPAIISPSFNPTTSTVAFDATTGYITANFQYDSSLNYQDLSLTFNPPKDPQFYYTQSFTAKLSSITDNNLALLSYDDSIYALIDTETILIWVLLSVSGVVFLVCFLGVSKLMGVEFIGVFQISYIGMLMIERLQALLNPIKNLKYVNGYNGLLSGAINNLPSRMSAIGYQSQLLANFNLDIILVVIPMLIGVMLVVVGKCRNSTHKDMPENMDDRLKIKGYRWMKEWQLSGLLFVCYHVMVCLGIAYMFSQHLYMIAIGAIIVVGLLVMCLLLVIRPSNFGDYKSFFKEGRIPKNYYVIMIVLRIMIGLSMVVPYNPQVNAFLSLGLCCLQLLLGIIMRPYLNNVRPILNSIYTIAILVIYTFYRIKMVYTSNTISTYLPLAIIIILFICIITNLIFIILYRLSKVRPTPDSQKQSDQQIIKIKNQILTPSIMLEAKINIQQQHESTNKDTILKQLKQAKSINHSISLMNWEQLDNDGI